ncbi:diguanylate cyclase [Variovorax sp. J22G21]|uniref:diguanylate cyclase domain-containing protein n=1 Tax=Variovorax fucosicus TaxID=3053517 RepID=UPI0025752133|nr:MULTISPECIES: diguanylate cyclase [unclassified Variovorax]MDM0038034.1 diguanylate cyclase [Variovorax sp. J22R193]MDM0062810.1 diguanylate cyclase [Variovorax sp. J22G21]
MRLTLPIKTAMLTTSLVLALVGAAAAWQYRSLSNKYVSLMQEQQQAMTQLAADGIDYKIGTHLNLLAREARGANAETFSTAQAQQRFLQESRLRTTFDGVALIALDGNMVASDPPNAKAVSIADRAYFQRARNGGITAISPPLRARTTDQPAIVIVVPVKDGHAHVVGFLGAGLELTRPNVLGDLARAQVGGGGHYVIETAGPDPVYIVHPDPTQVLQPASVEAADGFGGLVTSASLPTTGWTLRLVLPAQAAYAPLVAARSTLLSQMLLLALVCSVLVWAGTVWLMHPMGKLHKAIKKLRQSPDGDVALDIRAGDERGDLAREFDALMRDLRDKRSEMAAVMDASPLGLFRADAEGTMVYVNDAYLQIHGLDRSEASKGWLSLIPEDIRPQVWRDWQELVTKNQPYRLTQRLQRSDGAAVLISLQMRPVVADGRVVGQVGTLSDITERTHAEQALRTLTAIFEATPDYVVQLDTAGKLTYMNPAARRCTGIPLDASITHLQMADFNPPETLARLYNEVVPTAVKTGLWIGESNIWNADHQVFPVSHLVIAHRDKNGKLERFSGIMRDISAAKATERALSESEARLRTMADALPMRVAYVDASQRYQFVNQAYDGTFGFSRDAIPGRTVEELLGETAYRGIEPHLKTVLAGEPVTFQNEVVTATDHVFYEANYIPQRGADGNTIIGFHAVTTDITRQKREERRLVQLANQDPLTGLGNRSAFEKRLAESMTAGPAKAAPMALMYIDIDHFKQINDRWGHLCGDALLRAVAVRLLRATRAADFVARLGGDEFTVILQALRTPDDARAVAEKILKEMSDPFVLDDRTLNISASIGVAYYEGEGSTPKQLTQKADEMLYQAKGVGRNNCQMATFPESTPT